MSLRPSRRGLVPPFIAMDVLRAANERAAAGAEIIHLEVGQPGSSAPEPVLEAARRALVNEPIGYTDALGIAPLRREIAGHYQAQYGVPVDPAEVVVTTGSSAAFLLAFLAAFEAGDRVGLAIPGYPAYRNILSALGIEPVLIAVGENAHYQPTPELLADLGRLDGLIVASPANQRRRADPADRLLPRPRHPAGFGRDLPRDHLRNRRGDGARLWARGRHRQLILKILQHDWVAARLDAGSA